MVVLFLLEYNFPVTQKISSIHSKSFFKSFGFLPELPLLLRAPQRNIYFDLHADNQSSSTERMKNKTRHANLLDFKATSTAAALLNLVSRRFSKCQELFYSRNDRESVNQKITYPSNNNKSYFSICEKFK